MPHTDANWLNRSPKSSFPCGSWRAISEKLETKFQKLEAVPDSEERNPLQGKKAKRQKRTAALCVFAFLIPVAALTAKKAPMPLCLM